MKRRLGFLLVLAVLGAALAGCVGGEISPGHAAPAPEEKGFPACEHPWPCADGSEWPADLEGPFDLREPEHVTVESFDGTGLDGWILRPDVADGVQVPVVLWSTPYTGQTRGWGDDPGIREGGTVPIDRLVEEGYAVAVFNVRGTGLSGGCLDMFGPNEQKDQAILVEWLADQAWSNGRVGMMGLSYHATTAIEAAIQAPSALKTIVVAGIVSDWYLFYHTPQGAALTVGTAFQGFFHGLTTTPPAVGLLEGGAPERSTVEWAPLAPERVCPGTVRALSSPGKSYTDSRGAEYWEQRRFIDDMGDITAAVFLAHGLEDRWANGHQTMEDEVWGVLPDSTPKRMLTGQWEHTFPDGNDDFALDPMEDWNDRLLHWLDFWLKGIGPKPESLGQVTYQDGTGTWHNSTAWPPAEAREEVLHLAGDSLAVKPSEQTTDFRSIPDAVGSHQGTFGAEGRGWTGPICTYDDPAGGLPHGALYATDPLDAPVTLAGNPLAYLRIESDQPGGLVSVNLLALGPEFACYEGGTTPDNVTALTMGAADLRFHQGNMEAADFPVGDPTWARIDLTNLAEVVPAGHRIAALVSYGDPATYTAQPYTPQITVHGDSELVLPLVDGTLGGKEPTHTYPARPFVPPN